MKLSGLILGVSILFAASCTGSEIIPPMPRPVEEEDDQEIVEPVVSTKKGLGMSTGTTTGVWWKNIVNVKAHWYYTWGTSIPESQIANMPINAEFVPMFWGAGSITDASIQRVKDMKEAGTAKYVLGFNEPDLAQEANMTVEQALALWPRLEEIGLPLVSPVTSYPSLAENSWFVRFMDAAEAQGLRVDHVAVHLYVGSDPTTYINALTAVWEKYKKPIWITEFAVRDDQTGGDPSRNRYSPLDILVFMQRIMPELEKLDFIYRYTWFNPSPTMAGLYPCALFDSNGKLTILGEYYRDVAPNEDIRIPGE